MAALYSNQWLFLFKQMSDTSWRKVLCRDAQCQSFCQAARVGIERGQAALPDLFLSEAPKRKEQVRKGGLPPLGSGRRWCEDHYYGARRSRSTAISGRTPRRSGKPITPVPVET